MNKRNFLPFLLPVRCLIFFLIFVLCAFFSKQELKSVAFLWSIAATVVNFLTIIIILFSAKKIGISYFKLINYEKGKTTFFHLILMLVLIIFVGMAGMYLAGWMCYGIIPYSAPELIAPVPKVFAILNVILLPVSTALAEDGLYLGCGVNQIENKIAAVLIPSFFYAVQHSFIPFLFDFKWILYRFLCFLPLTVFLSIYFYQKRNPVPVMIGHAILDFATAVMILMTSLRPDFYQILCSMQQ